MNDFRFGNPALAAFIADMYEPMRKPMRTQVTRAPQAPGRLDLDKRETAALKAPAAPVKTYACETCEDTGEAAGDWIEWLGGTRPTTPEGFEFRIKLRSGNVHRTWHAGGNGFRWSHMGRSDDIVAYQLRPIQKWEWPASPTPSIELLNGEVYEIEFTGAATGTLVRRFVRWVTQGWCGTYETAEEARSHSLTLTKYLNNTPHQGRVANVKVLRHIPKEN